MKTRNTVRSGLTAKILLTILLSTLASAPNARAAVVNTLNDSGAGSLRQVITDLNAGGVAGTITFSVNGTITLGSDLPACRGHEKPGGCSRHFQGYSRDDQAIETNCRRFRQGIWIGHQSVGGGGTEMLQVLPGA